MGILSSQLKLLITRVSRKSQQNTILVLLILNGLFSLHAEATTGSMSGPAVNHDGAFGINWSIFPGSSGWTDLYESGTGKIYRGQLGAGSYWFPSKANGIYQYHVVGCIAGGVYTRCDITPTATVVVARKPSNPGISASTSQCSPVNVSWSPGSGYPSGHEKRYDLEQSVNGGSFTAQLSNSTATTWSPPTTAENTAYRYQVRAYYILGGQTSAKTDWIQSSIITTPQCTPGQPGQPNLNLNQTTVQVSWSASTAGRVDNYRLQRRQRPLGGSWSAWSTLSTSAVSPYSDANLPRGHDYEYQVRGENNASIGTKLGPWSTPQSIYVPYAPPSSPNLNDNVGGNAGYNGVYTLSWASAGGVVTGFVVEESETNTWPGTAVTPNNGPQAANYDKPSNFSGVTKYYYYRARAFNPDAVSPWMTWTVAVNFYPTPGAVDVFEQAGLATASGNYTLRWEPPVGDEEVTHYKLDRLDTPAVEHPVIPDVNGQAQYTQAMSGGVSGQSYQHAIEACFQPNEPGADEACSGYTQTLAVYIPYEVPNTPTNLIGPDGSLDGNFLIDWSPSTSGVLDHYELEETVNGTGSTIINAGMVSEFSRSNANGAYSFRVRACSPDADGPLTPAQACSAWSASVSFNAFTTPNEFEYSLNDASFLPDLGEGDLVAITQGKSDVSNGAALYTLPIELPPAVNDLKPNLALTYNSRGGNGLVGVGWSLSGFSTISRCSPTYATEGSEAQDSNPRYTDEDRLCLDGQKLQIATNSNASNATYWAQGAEYRTEIDSFARIQAFSGHQYFEVRTKDGRILSYGREEHGQNSRIYAPGQPGGPVSVWALDKVEDRYGNEYIVHYQRNTADGDYYPTHISFEPGASVVFSYEDRDNDISGYRSDIPWGHDKGYFHKHPKLLDKITTYINVASSSSPTAGTKVREYEINYMRSSTTDRYLVLDIAECGFNDVGARVCAEPVEFEWQPGELGFETSSSTLLTCSGQEIKPQKMGDVDNDGYVDLLIGAGVYWGTANNCYEPSGSWTYQDVSGWSPGPLVRTPRGMALIVTRDVSGSNILDDIGIVEYNRSTQTTNFRVITQGISPEIIVGDINNDNLDDWFYYLNNVGWTAWVQQLGNPANFVRYDQPAGTSWSTTEAGFADFNSDGLVDFLAYDKAFQNIGGHLFQYQAPNLPVSDTSAVQLYIGIYGSNSYMHLPGSQFRNSLDINGDGQLDLAWHRNPGGQSEGRWYAKLNTGDGFGPQTDMDVSSGARSNQYSFSYDWDKDGRQDLLACEAGSPGCGSWRVLLSTYDNGEPAFKSLATDPFNGALNDLLPVTISVAYANIFRGDLNNDGLVDVFYWPGSQVSSAVVYYAKRQQPDLLKTITNGFGAEFKFDYSPLVGDANNGQPLYTPSINVTFPERHAQRSLQVVKRLSVSNGQGSYRHRYFNYTGAKEHAWGRGFLGFEKIVVTDTSLSTVTTTDYRQDFPFIGQMANIEIKDSSGKLIGITDNHYTAHAQNARFPYVDYSIQRKYGLATTSSSSPISVTKVENTFDAYGNLTDQTTMTGSGLSGTTVMDLKRVVTVDNTITNNTSGWLLGFIEASTMQTSVNGSTGLRSVTTEFDPEPGTLDVKVRRDFVGTPVWKTTTTTRNANGVITSITSQASDLGGGTTAARTTSLDEFADLMYPGTRTNALGHETTLTYDERFGAVDGETDPNNRMTTRQYDLLGRLVKETASDGTVNRTIHYECANAPVICPAGAVYLEANEVTHAAAPGKLGAPLKIIYFDKLQREVRSETYSLNGTVVKVDTEHYADGRLHRVSEPFTGSSATDWTVYADYDALNRPLEITKGDGGSVEYAYSQENGLQRTLETVNLLTPNGSRSQVTTRYTDALGQVAQVLDANNTPVDYEYDSQGNLVGTTVNNSATTTIIIAHDVAGNKTSISDPDAGHISFEYNGFGELRLQTWQKNTAYEKSMAFSYDVLGRKTGRTDMPAGGSPVSYVWTWDTVKAGLLSSQSGNGVTETYVYDSLSRLQTLMTTITELGNRSFGYTYDAFSRLKTVTYPDGLVVERQYHAAGIQVQTRDISNINDPKFLWTLGEDSDVRGNLYQQRFGNGVVTLRSFNPENGQIAGIKTGWPTANGLMGMTGNIQDIAFEFDTLGNLYGRATARTEPNGDPLEYTAELFAYDNLNRLLTTDTTWLGIGMRNRTYNYDALGNLTFRSDLGTLLYGQSSNAGVHAISSANGQNYQYDNYGNLIQRGSETLDYDVFNKPTRIGATYFSYGPDHERFKQVSGNRTAYYINGGEYEEVVDNGVTTQRSYVGGYLVRSTTNSSVELSYLHKDHIGSVEAMTDRWGNLIDRMSFDPWGQRQEADWDTGNPTGGDTDYYPTARGFTGHEHLEQLDLIHMNGRVYDPLIGRFLSPDLYVQAPFNSQSFNRYSYVFNNPLSLVDPSGHTGCAANPTNGTTPHCEEVYVTGQRLMPPQMAMQQSFHTMLNSFYFQAQGFGYSFGPSPAAGVIISYNLNASSGNSAGGNVQGHGNEIVDDSDGFVFTDLFQEDGKFDKCHDACLEDNYGEIYEIAKDLSPLSALGIGTELGSSIASEALEAKLERDATRKLYGNWEDFNTGRRQLKTLTQFRKFNSAMAVVGVGATFFQITAASYCSVDCVDSLE